jgi:glycine cleavage system H protein
MKLDQNARYAESHEYVRKEGDELVIGISDFAQENLGDIVFVELPKVKAHINAKASFGTIESVKAASDMYLPVGGTVTAINGKLADAPDLVNKDCYGEGWLIKIRPDSMGDFDKLLSPSDYEKTTAGH